MTKAKRASLPADGSKSPLPLPSPENTREDERAEVVDVDVTRY